MRSCTLAPQEVLPVQRRGGPLLQPIKVLHRHDGYISFAVKSGDDFRPSFAIRASALDSMFPGYVDHLTKNSFVSINAAYTLSRANTLDVAGHPRHRKDTLKYLCACYCDVDHYKAGLSFDEARSKVTGMFRSGELPWASMIIDSGHGMWLLWLLHDFSNPTQAHHGAYDTGGEFDHLMVYSKINLAIVKKLKHLGGDMRCTDGARYIRFPGSFRTDYETTVRWSIEGTGTEGNSYTLWEMADLLGVQCRRVQPIEMHAAPSPRARGTVPGRAKGQRASNQHRLEAVRAIHAARGGSVDGSQPHTIAYVYATCLRWCGVPIEKALNLVLEMGRDCTPQISTGDCERAVESGYGKKQKRLGKATIARLLNVTREEAEIVAQRIGKPFPDEMGALIALTTLDGSPKKRDLAAMRRQEILRIVEEAGKLPTLRAMEEILKSRGYDVGSYVSIRSDYKSLGLETKRTKTLRENNELRNRQESLPIESFGLGDRQRCELCAA